MNKMKGRTENAYFKALDVFNFLRGYTMDEFLIERAQAGYRGANIALAEWCRGLGARFMEKADELEEAAAHASLSESDESFDYYSGNGDFIKSVSEKENIDFVGLEWEFLCPSYRYNYVLAMIENNTECQNCLAWVALDMGCEAEMLYWYRQAAKNDDKSAKEALHEFYRDKHFILHFDPHRKSTGNPANQ